MQVYEALANLDFGMLLAGASYQTQTGKALLEKYQSAVMSSPVTCRLVNSFLSEAKNCLYDSGVSEVYQKVGKAVSENHYSWLLATACENIEENNSSYNYLNRNAAKQVRKLLEMKEDDVVSYVKAGALKNVMYCESFREIAKAIFKDSPIVESKMKYTKTHPVSIVEKNDNNIYFVAASNIYKINTEDNTISEALSNEVSTDFLAVARLLESKNISYNSGVISFEDTNMKIEISESGIKKIRDNKETELTVEQLREQNALYVNGLLPQKRAAYVEILEGLAKIAESFDNICILDTVSLVSTANDLFLVIENGDNIYSKLLKSNHDSNWTINENAAEAVKFIKKRTWIDLSEEYKEKINNVIEKADKEEGEKIQESIRERELQARKEKIEELIEMHKDDPVKMAVLSKAAEKLGQMLS